MLVAFLSHGLNALHLLVICKCSGKLIFKGTFQRIDPNPSRKGHSKGVGSLVQPILDVCFESIKSTQLSLYTGLCELGLKPPFMAFYSNSQAVRDR